MASTVSQLDLQATYGCLFFTVILSTVLWGIGCLQLYFYFEKYMQSDKVWLKLYVSLTWSLDTVYLILVIKYFYVYFVKEFGNVSYLDHLPRKVSLNMYNMAVFAPIIVALVQCFFVHRAWKLSDRNRILTGTLVLSVVTQIAITVAYVHPMRKFTNLTQLHAIVNWERGMNSMVLFTDTFIALVLIYLLRKRQSGFKKTESMIKRLAIFTIGTGLVTSILALVALITSLASPWTFVYLLFDFIVSKVYFNCMLASFVTISIISSYWIDTDIHPRLNARSSLRGKMEGGRMSLNIRLDDLPPGPDTRIPEPRMSYWKVAPVPIECRVDIDVHNGLEITPKPTQDELESQKDGFDSRPVGLQLGASRFVTGVNSSAASSVV